MPKKALGKYFGYDDFRSYDDKPLQAQAVQSAINGESLLAVFPTGGGKSITFQIPALMAGEIKRLDGYYFALAIFNERPSGQFRKSWYYRSSYH